MFKTLLLRASFTRISTFYFLQTVSSFVAVEGGLVLGFAFLFSPAKVHRLAKMEKCTSPFVSFGDLILVGTSIIR